MKRLKKTMLLMLMLVFTLGMAIPVHAETMTETVLLFPPKYNDNIHWLGGHNREYVKKITGLKSSNKAVASAITKKDDTTLWVEVKLKKPGTTTISYKYKIDGKTETCKTKLTVQKYINPVASVKLGNTTIKGTKFKNTTNYNVKYSKFANKKVKFKVTPIKGWSVGWVEYSTRYFVDTEHDFGKNGGSIKVKGGKGFTIWFEMINNKTKQSEYFQICFK